MPTSESNIEASQDQVKVLPISALEINKIDSAFVRPSVSFVDTSLMRSLFQLFSISQILNVSSFRLQVHKTFTTLNRDKLALKGSHIAEQEIHDLIET